MGVIGGIMSSRLSIVPSTPSAGNAPPSPLTGAIAATSSSPSFCIRVVVRDSSFTLRVAGATQNFKWLGNTVAYRYALLHPQFNHDQFIPIHITNKDHAPLFPSELINERCADGEEVHVELLGPRLCPNDPGFTREKTLWELFAYTPPHDYVSVVITFDQTPFLQMGGSPAVFGNFNGWGPPVAMKKSNLPNIWRHTMEMPLGAELVFKFALLGTGRERHVVSKGYRIVSDKLGTELNYLRVRMEGGSYEIGESESSAPVANSVSESLSAPDAPKVLSQRVVGVFQGVRNLTDTMKAAQFENDWKNIQLADVIRALDKRMIIKELLWKYSDKLRVIFRYYSSQGGQSITCMNVMGWVYFCHVCAITDKRVSVSRLDQIFHRVNVEEEYDEKKLAENPTEYRNAMILKEDPFNPNNQFIRGEFYEALVRVALVKFPSLEAHAALEKLVNENVFPHALEPSTSDIRERLLDEGVQKVYQLYSKRLYKLFWRYAKADRTDLKPSGMHTINVKEFEMMLNDYKLTVPENMTGARSMAAVGAISRRVALTAFAMSQQEELTEASDHLYEMVYAEFLEVLARLAEAREETLVGDTSERSLADALLALLIYMFPPTRTAKLQRLAERMAEAKTIADEKAAADEAAATAKREAAKRAKRDAIKAARARAEKAKAEGIAASAKAGGWGPRPSARPTPLQRSPAATSRQIAQ